MTPAQIKALLAEGVKEFAGYRRSIEDRLPYGLKSSYANIASCPVDLQKMTVIQDGAKWDELYTFGCGGDKEHKTPRRNGVLVEFELPEKTDRADWEKYAKEHRLAELVTRDGQKYVRLIVSRKAIIVPWGEYAMVQAEREKQEEIHEQRRAEILAVADALRIPEVTRSTGFYYDRTNFAHSWLIPRKQEDDYHRQRRESAHYILKTTDFNGQAGLAAYFGTVEMPMDHGQKLVDALNTLREIADPANRHSKRAQEMAANAIKAVEGKPKRKVTPKKEN